VQPGTHNVLSWRDVLLALTLVLIGGSASHQGSTLIPPILLSTYDVWFESDLARIYDNMADRWSDHYRTKVHPAFSLLTHPVIFGLKHVGGLDAATSIRTFNAAIAGVWLAVLFVLLRIIGCRPFDAALFAMVAASTAASCFWLLVPETYPLGSLSIISALLLTALAERRLSSEWPFVVVSALTLSFTVTNWMAGLAATFAHFPWRRSLQISVNAFCLVILLWAVQKYLFPSAQFFLGDREETKYALDPEAGGLFNVARSFFVHSAIMPAFRVAHEPGWQVTADHLVAWPKLMTQDAALGSGSRVAWLMTVLWLTLIGFGALGFLMMRTYPCFRFALGTVLLGQLLLHSIYGNETFLYSLHFVPLLVIVAALNTLTAARPLALMMAAILLIGMAFNNGWQLTMAVQVVHAARAERDGVREQMNARPTDPWPRSQGHVVLAVPGTAEIEKGYLEPGGSFSPSVGTFGVSLWVTDEHGHLLATSDDMPLATIRQHLMPSDTVSLVGVMTETPYYRAKWSLVEPNRWMFDLQRRPSPKTRTFVVIRSIGPAGGPVRALNWDGHALLVNNEWTVTLDPAPSAVDVGEEGQVGWTQTLSAFTQWSGESGWGYARLELSAAVSSHMEIHRNDADPETSFPAIMAKSAVHINIPDPEFMDSLTAQTTHLLMGLVGWQTRPGDPMNYPLPWLRDGAYAVVAFAHAGYLEVAQALGRQFAEEDFFGGFGPEADAPGLAIWALAEVAARVGRAEYDHTIWPHVRRKAELIEMMLDTTRPIFRPIKKPIVPTVSDRNDLGLVCEAARDGLIIGRMDNHRPLLFVNAASYRGLLDASALATRIGQPDLAQQWRTRADRLRQAWEHAFLSPESNNDRTYANGFWPTGVAGSFTNTLQEALQSRWHKLRTENGAFREPPLWTYFDLGEAHQWLWLNRSDRVWQTLRWFWDHQTSPGLYTWWEGDQAENDFHRWDGIRGWVHRPYVTPHYWTAAEMALLQLDMLTYWDESTPEPTIVIGAGIPSHWLHSSMDVSGLPLPGGTVEWHWDGRRMHVQLKGPLVKIRLGPAFPVHTLLNIEHVPIGPADIVGSVPCVMPDPALKYVAGQPYRVNKALHLCQEAGKESTSSSATVRR
jgi:hypothetical protein